MFCYRLNVFASTTLACLLFISQPCLAVDFHAFEFSGGIGQFLSQAPNTGTPGIETWDESNLLTDSETDGAGNFRIAKFNDSIANNYLQIENITSSTVGSRYIVVRMSGWDFYDNVPGEGEEIRFDFLDDDTGNSGSSVTSQVRIDRNTDTGDIELRGTAIGVGSSDISSRATLNTTQTSPFTMVLELNKTSNTYEVFYKDGPNPSQALGAAPISPGRNGNSMRFTVNNNFGSTLDEFFSIDRIALSDTNPLTDLMTLEVDRITGVMTLKNTTGAALSNLRSYSITSEAGALNSANWKSVTDNYDQAPQNGSVDIDGAWSKTSTTAFDLSEGVIGGNGGNLSNNQMVVLSQGSGSWIKSPIEDLEVTLNFDGGITRKANVNFVGNGGKRFVVGDLDFNGSITTSDWTIFNAGAELNLAGLTEAQKYQAGDLNNDGFNDIFDFSIFKNAYVAANGLPAFEALIAGVPEPSTVLLLATGSLLLLGRRRRLQQNFVEIRLDSHIKHEDRNMTCFTKPLAGVAMALAVLFIAGGTTQGAILEEFLFDDPNGTLLADTSNNATPGNMWGEDTVDMSGSSVQNGKYRIQKSNNDFGTNYLDVANVTSGKAWWVAEMSGWNFSSIVGPGEFDAGEPEEIRFAFLNNDGNAQGGSTITAQANIQRNSAGGIELVGRLTTGAPEFGPLPLTLNRTTPFTVVLEIDEDAENYSVYYKDNAGPFTLLGTAPHQSGRDGLAVRFVANNNFGGTGEFFDIDRMYLTNTNPTNVNPDRLTLQVDAASGLMRLINDTSTTFEIDAYTISSSTISGDLNIAGWNSLNDRVPGLDAVDGPDGGTTAGDGVGETWDEAPGSSNKVLAERFLLGKSVFATNRMETLGNAFKVGGDINSLSFQYRNADTGAVVTGNVVPASLGINADFDGDGNVDGRDFLLWQQGATSPPLSAAALAAWKAQYGSGTLQAAAQAVPEPVSVLLIGMGLVGLGCFRTRRLSL
ncbi:PEP-CTERM sorting domain-containing protein [Bythopirellula polymerisocia]|uniref:PEP-CTERM motif protein n=1 Tax=Bythopirellula polymerisocia TaxID=2528003 RepID=A0A5C6CWT1_9BACT|nr:PEP-CTERM sorting domain-containing protein [Bythopirellula polymerisocia]TWU29423.1 PEP-CTERM motif protein [Bythopirellula polymerisocia]